MEMAIYQIVLLCAAMFFVGYLLQQNKVAKFRQEKLRAEDFALKSDSEYLKMVQENETLKNELRHYDQENDMLIKLQEELIRKKGTR
jgi:hypothetical protein